jgi:hypothetical protein
MPHPFTPLQVIASNTADAETRQKAAQEKEEALKEQSAQIAVRKGSGAGSCRWCWC